MDISKETLNNVRNVMEKHVPEVITTIGIAGVLVSAEINAKERERLTKADSYMDASYELCSDEVVQNRGIFYRVKKFFKRIFHR